MRYRRGRRSFSRRRRGGFSRRRRSGGRRFLVGQRF